MTRQPDDVGRLIARARAGDAAALGTLLETFRPYLALLARLQIGRRLQGKADPADLVQEAFLEAHRDFPGFRGTSEGELMAWLRQILARNLANAVRDLRRDKRDVARERSLEPTVEESAARLEAWLVAEQLSPSERAERDEEAVRLAQALATLPEAQREVVLLRHCQGWSLADISRQVGRSPSAVAGLLHRGLQHLRTQLEEPE